MNFDISVMFMLDLDNVKVNLHATCPGQRSFTHMHTGPIAAPGLLQVVDNNLYASVKIR